MKTQSFLLLFLATATTIKACGGGCYSPTEGYPQQPYDNIGYPTYIPSNAPVNQGGYASSPGYYGTHLVPEPKYPIYPQTQSYGQNPYPTGYTYAPVPTYKGITYPGSSPYLTPGTMYTVYAPEPTPVGIPPTPAYNELTTIPYISMPYVTPKINSSYMIDTSTTMYVTTSKYASSSMHSSPTSVTLPIQTSSASNMKEITTITWAWMVACGGVAVGIGLHIRF